MRRYALFVVLVFYLGTCLFYPENSVIRVCSCHAQSPGVVLDSEHVGVDISPETRNATDSRVVITGEKSKESDLRSQDVPEKKVPWIFIPIDENGNVTGKEYYVPLDFYSKLYRTSQLQETATGEVFFRSARYQASMRPDARSRHLVLNTFEITYELEVRNAPARIILPFSPEDVFLSQDAIRLDTSVISPSWQVHSSESNMSPTDAVRRYLAVNVTEPGRHTLSLQIRPAIRKSDGRDEYYIRFPIPEIASAQLEVEVPAETLQIQFPSALGETRYIKDKKTWKAELGCSHEVHFSWTGGGVGGNGDSIPVVEESYLWQIEPSKSVLTAHYTYKMQEGRVKKLQWYADPRLKVEHVKVSPLGLEDSLSAQCEVHSVECDVEGEVQRIRVEFTADLVRPFILEVAFSLPPQSTSGDFPPPWVRPWNVYSVKRWYAVSADAALKVKRVDLTSSTSRDVSFPAVALPEFQAAWRVSDAAVSRRVSSILGGMSTAVGPDTVTDRVGEIPGGLLGVTGKHPSSKVLEVPGEGHTDMPLIFAVNETITAEMSVPARLWVAQVRPVVTSIKGSDTLSLLSKKDALHVVYTARITPGTLPVYQHTFYVPTTFIPDMAYYRLGTETHLLQLGRSEKNRVTLFFQDPPGGEYILVLRGRIPWDRAVSKDPQNVKTPKIELNDHVISSHEYQFFRSQDILLEVENAVSGVGGASTSQPFSTESALYVASFTSSTAEGNIPASFTVKENNPEVSCQMRTMLELEDSGWKVRCQLMFQVRNGLMDVFTVELPDTWKGPLTFSPQMPFTVENYEYSGVSDTPDTSSAERMGRRYVLRPSATVSGALYLEISGPLNVGEMDSVIRQENVVLPVVQIPGVQVTVREVVVPELQPQVAVWSADGMLPYKGEPLKMTSPDISAQVTLHQGVQFYRVNHPNTQMHSLKLYWLKKGDSKLDLLSAHHRICWDVDEKILGLTTLDLQPQGVSSVTVQIPPEMTVIEFRLDSLPIQVSELEGRKWMLDLHSPVLPQRLEILYYGHLKLTPGSGMSSLRQFSFPHAVNVTRPRETFILEIPVTFKVNAHTERDFISRPWQRVEMASLEQTLDIVRTVLSRPDSDPNQIRSWATLWYRRWLLDIQRVQDIISVSQDAAISGARDQSLLHDIQVLKQTGDELFRKILSELPSLDTAEVNWMPLFRTFMQGNSKERMFYAYEMSYGYQPELNLLSPRQPRRISHVMVSIFFLTLTIIMVIGLFIFPKMLLITRTSPFWLALAGVGWFLMITPLWGGYILWFAAVLITVKRWWIYMHPVQNRGKS